VQEALNNAHEGNSRHDGAVPLAFGGLLHYSSLPAYALKTHKIRKREALPSESTKVHHLQSPHIHHLASPLSLARLAALGKLAIKLTSCITRVGHE
jgi:hypothetical protein